MYLRILLVLALLCGTAQARDWRDSERGTGSSAATGLSLDAAVASVERRGGGRILSARTEWVQGRKVHRIKVLTDTGRVRVFSIDGGGR